MTALETALRAELPPPPPPQTAPTTTPATMRGGGGGGGTSGAVANGGAANAASTSDFDVDVFAAAQLPGGAWAIVRRDAAEVSD